MIDVDARVLVIAGAGALAGLHHALTGPDHLAAVAPFAAARGARAWRVGIAWGFGHACGAGLAAVLALCLRSSIPGVEQQLSSISERLVGVLLCLIGVLGMRGFLRPQVRVHAHQRARTDLEHSTELPYFARHRHPAFTVGLFHGAAGLSHLFGVLPALALPGMFLPSVYLGAYGAASLLAVTLFACTIGWFDRGRQARARPLLLGATSLASLAVGMLWLVHPM